MTPWLVLLTILLPWTGALLVWLLGDRREKAQHATAVLFALAAAAAAVLLIPRAIGDVVFSVDMGSVFGAFTLVPDGLGVFLTAVATVVGSLAVIFSVDYMRGAAQLGRYYALVLLFIGAMAGLALSGSLLLLFLYWEITALCSYALISFYNDDPKAVRGGIKALIITSLGGIGLLVGALVAFAYVGDYQIASLLAQAETLPPTVRAILAFGLLAAAAAKSAQVPFQTWLPDAMEAPSPVSALIHAATMVNAGVYLLARFYPAFADVAGWKTAVATVGLLSALLAAVMALTATDLKRVLAYSTVSQLGYMIYAIGVGGLFASQFHLFSHAIFKALLFLAAGAIIHAIGTRDMRQMGGLWQPMRFTGVVFLLGAGALAGLPILNGFWSKELILEAGLANGPLWAYAGMLLGAGITALYTLRMVWLVLFAPPLDVPHAHPVGNAMKTALAPLAAGTLLTWLAAGPFVHWLQETLPFHHLHVVTTGELAAELFTAPATYLALVVVAVGLAVWWQRNRFVKATERLAWLQNWAVASFGFEWVNGRVVRWTQSLAGSLQLSQTGQLSWNVLGIMLGLITILALLVMGS